ncbi:hypothetical protein LSTR_LSTR016123 [Laodelphax striatellus]|uniref:Uncharacterized protein n=1 Tax=Laodelphax striatellus TaxID=195883 RepID=A0A482WU53_LAOST|nr:hypothetical protein LSTR_LSTR016123 [Laodelphax striatellus]
MVGMANALGGVFDLMADSINLLLRVISYYRGRSSVSTKDTVEKVKEQLAKCLNALLKEFRSSLVTESDTCVQNVVSECRKSVDVSDLHLLEWSPGPGLPPRPTLGCGKFCRRRIG